MPLMRNVSPLRSDSSPRLSFPFRTTASETEVAARTARILAKTDSVAVGRRQVGGVDLQRRKQLL